MDSNVGKIGTKVDQDTYKELVTLSIICHEYPFSFVEHKLNRKLHSFLCQDTVKPISRNTAKTRCLKIHNREMNKLKKILSKLLDRICLTSDMWTSCVSTGYPFLTAHYVNTDWRLCSKILNFCHIPPPHSA